jgi:4-amino-4-deoxy-L-arabinose transferase-like glycosyltransferase
VTAAAISAVRARRLRLAWHHAALGGVLFLAAALDLVHLGRNGYANTYYAGAVRSMLHSWRNFFFVSFDQGGLVSVDKPPLALWVEAASAKVFGYSSLAILVPEALAGVAAVWVLYLLVARFFGRVAGLVAALALATSPVSVAVNRDNNPDALFVLLLVLAAYAGARAVASGRLRTLLLTAVLVGLAFNTKMLAAAIVVPGLALAYALFAPVAWRRRLVRLALAGVVMVAISGAWIAAVDLTPASQRPYVGSTTDNSALSLALGYNGLGRVDGQTGGTSVGGGLGGAFSGRPGVLRLLNSSLGDQGGWLLALAIVGGVSLLAAAIAARRRRDLGALTVLGGWFLAAAVVFSFSKGIIHTYYVSALAPAIAALVGAGAVSLARDARRGGLRMLLPLAAVGLSAWLELALLRRSGYDAWLQWVVAAGAVVAIGALAVPRLRWAALAVATAALLAAPAAWSATTWTFSINGVFPGAGPSFLDGQGGGGGPQGGGRGLGGPPGGGFAGGPATGFGGGARRPRPTGFGGPPGGGTSFGGAGQGNVQAALSYVEKHGATKRFALIVSSEEEAAQYVVDGDPVAAMGGFTGRETVLTPSFLSSLVRGGEARYFLVDDSNDNAAVSTVTSICTRVTGFSSGSLYDCAGKADAIAASG